MGIADHAGEMEFWVSDHDEWSSFLKEQATMAGATATALTVTTMRFGDLLDEYPLPEYVKIDIEGNDTLCIRALGGRPELPPFVSFEGHLEADADIAFLAGLGYGRFKCIRQNDWREITPRNMRYQGQWRKVAKRTDRHPLSRKVVRKVHYYRRPGPGGWRFEPGGAGPLAWELPGRWITSDEALAVWDYRLALDKVLDAGGMGEWYDFHAAR